MGKGGKIAMIIIGAILLIVGIYMLTLWSAANAPLQAALAVCNLAPEPTKTACTQAANLLYGSAGMLFLVPGIILLAVGAILLLVGLLKLKSA